MQDVSLPPTAPVKCLEGGCLLLFLLFPPPHPPFNCPSSLPPPPLPLSFLLFLPLLLLQVRYNWITWCKFKVNTLSKTDLES